MYKRILAGFDGSEASLRAVERAAELASHIGAELHVITVVPPPSVILGALMTPEVLDVEPLKNAALKRLENLSKMLSGKYSNIKVDIAVLEGSPADTLIDYAESNKCDLIVVGRRGLSSIERILMGSVSQRIASKSTRDVLIIP